MAEAINGLAVGNRSPAEVSELEEDVIRGGSSVSMSPLCHQEEKRERGNVYEILVFIEDNFLCEREIHLRFEQVGYIKISP
ncbi:MAG: hypothetical protein HOC74_25545 [Gemmatimonadetes bacterium]|jgi:hypothetical protein|nr:hypothetical protein [Gemmatimonadota bacterium]